MPVPFSRIAVREVLAYIGEFDKFSPFLAITPDSLRELMMTIDKSLKIRRGSSSSRSVLTRIERLQRLKEADRWQEGDSPLGLPKVRVRKLVMKKKKKKKEEEGDAAAGGAAAAAPAKGAAAKSGGKK